MFWCSKTCPTLEYFSSACVCVYGHHFQLTGCQLGMVANPARACSFSTLRLIMFPTGLHSPFPLSATVSIRTVMRHRANPEFIRSCNFVKDDIHYRESAGTGPEALTVAQQTGASYSGNSVDQLICAPLFYCCIDTLINPTDQTTPPPSWSSVRSFPFTLVFAKFVYKVKLKFRLLRTLETFL